MNKLQVIPKIKEDQKTKGGKEMLEKREKIFKHLLKHVPVAVNNIPVQCNRM